MIEWRRVVQEYPCMVCGAAPGRKCRTKSGATAYTPHYLRTQAASENNWKDPEVKHASSVGHSGISNPSKPRRGNASS